MKLKKLLVFAIIVLSFSFSSSLVNAQGGHGEGCYSDSPKCNTGLCCGSGTCWTGTSNSGGDCASAVSLNPTGAISWASSTGATSYNLQISDKADFSNLLVNRTDIKTTTFSPLDLKVGQTYYYRLKAVNNFGSSAWSTAYVFNPKTTTDISTSPDKTNTTVTTNTSSTNSLLFTKTLKIGDKGDEVLKLQKALAETRNLSPEFVSGVYDTSLVTAVGNFQINQKVLKTSRDAGYGLFGPTTMKKMNEVYVSNSKLPPSVYFDNSKTGSGLIAIAKIKEAVKTVNTKTETTFLNKIKPELLDNLINNSPFLGISALSIFDFGPTSTAPNNNPMLTDIPNDLAGIKLNSITPVSSTTILSLSSGDATYTGAIPASSGLDVFLNGTGFIGNTACVSVTSTGGIPDSSVTSSVSYVVPPTQNCSVGNVNGENRVTTWINSTKLKVTLLPSDLSVPSIRAMNVFSPFIAGSPSGVFTNSKMLKIGSTTPNPTPVLSSTIYPSHKNQWSDNFQITVVANTIGGVSGTFLPNSVVRWNGVNLVTTYVNPSMLKANVPGCSDIACTSVSSKTKVNGAYPITVCTPVDFGTTCTSTSGLISNAVNFTIDPANRVPVITSVSPNVKDYNAGFPLPGLTTTPLNITLNGKYFVPGAVVKFDGNTMTTTYVSSIKLTFSLPPTYLYNNGTYQAIGSHSIIAINPTPVGGASNEKSFFVNLSASLASGSYTVSGLTTPNALIDISTIPANTFTIVAIGAGGGGGGGGRAAHTEPSPHAQTGGGGGSGGYVSYTFTKNPAYNLIDMNHIGFGGSGGYGGHNNDEKDGGNGSNGGYTEVTYRNNTSSIPLFVLRANGGIGGNGGVHSSLINCSGSMGQGGSGANLGTATPASATRIAGVAGDTGHCNSNSDPYASTGQGGFANKTNVPPVGVGISMGNGGNGGMGGGGDAYASDSINGVSGYQGKPGGVYISW